MAETGDYFPSKLKLPQGSSKSTDSKAQTTPHISSTDPSRPKVILTTRTPNSQEENVRLVPDSAAVPASPGRLRFSSAEAPLDRLQREREEYIAALEERFSRGEETRIPRTGIVAEGSAKWESQFSEASIREGVFSCVATSFQNALKTMNVYNPELDSQENLIRETRDLFGPAGVSWVQALTRMTANREGRGIRMQTVNFQQAIDALLEGKAVTHGHAGHHYFLQRIEARKNPETNLMEIGVRRVDPLKPVGQVRSEFVSLHQLVKEEPSYRAFYVAPKVRLPSRK